MSLALDEGMWSRAAEEGLRLIDLSVGWPRMLEYALAGLCQSDLAEERARLRKSLPEATYTRICRASPRTPRRRHGGDRRARASSGWDAISRALPRGVVLASPC